LPTGNFPSIKRGMREDVVDIQASILSEVLVPFLEVNVKVM
jgi:hypothetical protein